MPTLDWIGKKAVLSHHRQVPYRLLHCDAKLSVPALPPREGLGEGRPLVRIIYAEGCRLGPARLKREGLVFRQIPYEIKVT